jgi:hypothetical protein
MEKFQNIYRPKSLPQISAPFSYVAHQLNDIGQPYELLGANLDSINPSQAFVDSDTVNHFHDQLKNGEEIKTVWLDKDNNMIDGHQRYAAHSLNKNTHIPSVRLMCDKDTAIQLLNDIQSKFENENNSDIINAIFEDRDSSMYTPEKQLPTKKESVKAFRKQPIINKSISGNFFSLVEIPNSKPYEIAFDALLDADQVNPSIKKEKNPVAALAQAWFPDLNFQEYAPKFGMTLDNFINTIVAEKARTKGIDAIVYGEKLLQSIDKK